MHEARAQTARGVGGHAEGLGYFVGGLEADAPDVLGQAVGVVADHLDGVVAVGLEDLDREGRRDAVGLQEEHHFLDALLILPGLGDHPDALGPDTGHLGQPLGVGLDHLKDGHAEVGHHALGRDGPDALDQPGAQVLLNAGQRGGLLDVVAHGLELWPVLGVVRPATPHAQALARRDRAEVPDDGHQVTLVGRLDLDDRVAVLGVVVGDALHEGLEAHHRRGLFGGVHGVRHRSRNGPRPAYRATAVGASRSARKAKAALMAASSRCP
ncbi:hypothetical protein D3C72_1151960 [compost metagenome]